ncbi:MAG: 2-oxoacid:acceptor oxidoreductase subunit alpha [Deltaproteobacteria bacterium]|nr:2-oxoacid:acceptor oxidoreductase subunit alpha [Deltaproteobacteria bacterium]
MATPEAKNTETATTELDQVIIRFAGDSGDGMQLTGTQFTNTSAMAGNDLSTLPDYPAEIRAPAGTVAGVSGFQVAFSSKEVYTPGDELDVLVCMNPAALKRYLHDVKSGGTLLVNSGAFTDRGLKIAGYEENPVNDGSLSGYRVIEIDITALTAQALSETELTPKQIDRCKNFYTLGVLYWMYSRDLQPTLDWIADKFKGKGKEKFAEANALALKAGHAYGETAEIFQGRYEVGSRKNIEPGTYTALNGNRAVALGMVAASERAGIPLFLGSYPITPASEILHELSYLKHHDVVTFQAEDEIAAACSMVGASFAGHLALTTTSGPGLALKTEAIGLGVIAELPMVIVNVQRGGPSTGLPTKTEQADLMQSIYGRNGEAPVPVLAARSPAECFHAAVEAARIAVKYMTPVILLTDGYLANGSEPFRVPTLEELPEINVKFADDPATFQPYSRDEKTLARPWAIPGTPGLEHRIGGLEKQDVTGGVSYDPDNHHKMIGYRAEKIRRIAKDIEAPEINGDDSGKLLILGWGSTFGVIATTVERLRKEGKSVSQMHLRHLFPMHAKVGETLKKFDKVLVPEINFGQLDKLLRLEFLADNLVSLGIARGLPLKTADIMAKANELLG